MDLGMEMLRVIIIALWVWRGVVGVLVVEQEWI